MTTERTVVAIGCSTARDYSFLLPLSCALWREVVGFHPLALLVGDWSGPRSQVVLRALEHLGVEHRLVGVIEGYPDATVAQNVRQHACALDLPGDDWVMMSDADLWPIRGAFYHQHEGFTGKAVSYYSNGDHFFGKKDVLAKFDAGGGFQSLPTCHVVMRGSAWREVYSVEGDLVGSTKRTLERMEPWLVRCPDSGLARWCCDQWYMTERLCRQEWFPEHSIPGPCPPSGRILELGGVRLIERHGTPPADRLDRGHPSHWQRAFDPSRWVDAHVHKAPEEDSQWEGELRTIGALLPGRVEWAKDYREEYVEASK